MPSILGPDIGVAGGEGWGIGARGPTRLITTAFIVAPTARIADQPAMDAGCFQLRLHRRRGISLAENLVGERRAGSNGQQDHCRSHDYQLIGAAPAIARPQS